MLTVLGQPKVSPTVYLFPPSSDELSTRSKATLVCLLADFYPGNVEVTWTVDGRTRSSGVDTSLSQRNSNNKYMASSYLLMTASEWENSNEVICKVKHEAGNVEKIMNRSECY